jgi:hypothetical protein
LSSLRWEPASQRGARLIAVAAFGVSLPWAGSTWAEPSAAESAPDTFVDTAGNVREVEDAERDLLPTRDGHHERVLIGIGVGLAVGSFAYWIDQDRNVADWDDPSLEARFTGDAWRFDNNNLYTNFLLHPLSGGGAYNLARANHLGWPAAVGYASLSSFLWEWVLEFKEQVSVNDSIATSFGGVPLGEFFYKLGLYLDSADRPSVALRAARLVLGTGVQLDRFVDGDEARVPRARDSLGLTSAIWHDFAFRYTLSASRGATSRESSVHDLGFSGRLVSIPGYLRPGDFGFLFQRADVTSLEVWSEGSTHGAGMGVYADTMLVGYHAQQVGGTREVPHGYAATVGTSLAYRFLDSAAHGFAEKLSVIHFPGLAFDWSAVAEHIGLHVSARTNLDFAALGTPAYADWAEANPDERGKAILRRQGYFYGFGGSASATGKLELGPVRIGGDVYYGRYRSQEGLERHPEKMTVDVPADGSVMIARASLGVAPPGLPIEVGVRTGVRRWKTQVGGFPERRTAMDQGLSVTAAF